MKKTLPKKRALGYCSFQKAAFQKKFQIKNVQQQSLTNSSNKIHLFTALVLTSKYYLLGPAFQHHCLQHRYTEYLDTGIWKWFLGAENVF